LGIETEGHRFRVIPRSELDSGRTVG
jgi:hypothetical protein